MNYIKLHIVTDIKVSKENLGGGGLGHVAEYLTDRAIPEKHHVEGSHYGQQKKNYKPNNFSKLSDYLNIVVLFNLCKMSSLFFQFRA